MEDEHPRTNRDSVLKWASQVPRYELEEYDGSVEPCFHPTESILPRYNAMSVPDSETLQGTTGTASPISEVRQEASGYILIYRQRHYDEAESRPKALKVPEFILYSECELLRRNRRLVDVRGNIYMEDLIHLDAAKARQAYEEVKGWSIEDLWEYTKYFIDFLNNGLFGLTNNTMPLFSEIENVITLADFLGATANTMEQIRNYHTPPFREAPVSAAQDELLTFDTPDDPMTPPQSIEICHSIGEYLTPESTKHPKTSNTKRRATPKYNHLKDPAFLASVASLLGPQAARPLNKRPKKAKQ